MIWALLAACIVPLDGDSDGKNLFEDCNDYDATLSDPVIWYLDHDGDGYGDPTRSFRDCEQPSGYVAEAGDCDDDSPDVPSERLLDEDGDGFFSAWCTGGDDCDDNRAYAYPGAQELCTGLKEACDNTDWSSDAGLVVWLEEIRVGTLGESCAVSSSMDGEEPPEDCTVLKCPVGETALSADLCCICDLSERFAALSDTSPGVWNIQLPEGLDDFVPDGQLSFCEGEWPINLSVNQTSGQEQRVTITGASILTPEQCESGDEQAVTVLRGSGDEPVVFAAGNGGLILRMSNLVVRSDAECTTNPSSSKGGIGGGILLRNLLEMHLDYSCVRQNTSSSGQGEAGGGISLFNVDDALLHEVAVRDNCAFSGAGLYASASRVELMAVTIADNIAWTAGGGVHIYGSGDDGSSALYADDLLLENNSSGTGFGAGLLLWGNPDAGVLGNLVQSTVSHNVGAGITLVETVNVSDTAQDVCSEVRLSSVVFAGQAMDADVDTYNAYTNSRGEVLGQGLDEVELATYSVEACP